MTREDYHKSPRISNSSLDWILPETGGSPKKFEERHLFPIEEVDSSEMRLGTLAHRMIELKGDLSKFETVSMPSPGILRICDEVLAHPTFDLVNAPALKRLIVDTARAQDFQPRWGDDAIFTNVSANGLPYMTKVDGARAAGIELVSEEEMAALRGMYSSLEETAPWLFDEKGRHPHGGPGDKIEIFRELPVEWQTDVVASGATYTLECKSLIDILVVNHTEKWYKIYDFKTTKLPLSLFIGHMSKVIKDNKIVEEFVPGAMHRRRIHRQLAFYKAAIANGAPSLKEYEQRPAAIIPCETIAPYESTITHLNDLYSTLGEHEVRKALQLIALSGVSPSSGL